MDVITSFPSYFQTDAQSISLLYAGIIALFFGLANASVAGLFVVSAFAAVVYIAAQAVVPPLISHTPIVMPVLDKVLLEQGLVLYVVFFAAILVVYIAKKSVLGIIG